MKISLSHLNAKVNLLICFSAAILLSLAFTVNGQCAELSFASKPVVSGRGQEIKISFSVAASCDVQVEIINAASKVVRHLGGGVLGSNSPRPFQKGLKQELTWDGKDDFGAKAVGGPFKVQVGLGLKASFDKILGWSGENLDSVRGICCGPDGTFYALYGGQLYGHRRTTLISAYSRDGKYLRQVLPGPGGMSAEKRKGWPHAKLQDGREHPIVWHTLSRAIYPGLVLGDRCFPIVTPENKLMVINSPGCGSGVTHNDFRGGRRLLVFGTDGSVPENYLGAEISKDQTSGHGWTALSPDGKTAYVSGIGGGKKARKQIPFHNVVYQLPVDGSKIGQVLIGKLNQAGKGAGGLNQPCGIDTDKAGNIYVADSGNNRLAIFDKDGKHLKNISVPTPWQVKVSSRSGEIYAIVENGARLVKYSALASSGGPQQKASLPVPGFKKYKISFNSMLALDDSAEQHRVWLLIIGWHRIQLHQLLDNGKTFEDQGNPIKKNAQRGINFTAGLAPIGDKVVTMTTEHGKNWSAKQMAVDVETGKVWKKVFKGRMRANEVIAGKDGLLYTIGGGWKKPHPVHRFDVEFKELPFANGNPIKGFWHGHTRTSGMFADRHGFLYLLGADEYRKHGSVTVRKYSPAGKLLDKKIVKLGSVYYGGIVVDSRQNVYLGLQVRDKDKPIPSWFDGKLPQDDKHHRPSRAYRQYGAVVKFKPTGGAVVKDPAGKHYSVLLYGNRGPSTLKNALWVRRGGEVPVRGNSGDYDVHCFCETSRFDIDFHDRLFVPDIHRFCVQVLDSAGNVISLIGSYGNMDNQGPASAHPQPAIPYGWPLVAKVAGNRLFVTDLTNRRIVVARLSCSVTETCSIK
jgi:NHL repeat